MSLSDPVMVALVNKLPPIGTEWPVDQRLLWLQACEAVLNMIYGPVEKIEIGSFLAEGVRRLPGTIKTGDVISEPGGPLDGAVAGEVLTSGDTDDDEPEELASEPPAVKKVVPEPAPKNVGGRPSSASKPEGLPTNLQMAIEAITALAGSATAPEIRAWVRKRYWGGAPDSWSANLWDHAKLGRLVLDRGTHKFSLPESERLAAVERQADKVAKLKPPRNPMQVLPTTSIKAPMPSVQPTAGKRPPAPKPPMAFPFEHMDRKANLASSREYALAGKLRVAMGKGHLSESFLASTVIGSDTESNRAVVRDVCLRMNDALAEVGLKIEHYPNYGLIMKEVAGG